VGGNLETAAIYHFLLVTKSPDSLEVAGGNAFTTSGARRTSEISVSFLSSLTESDSSIKRLRLVNIYSPNSLSSQFFKFKALKILSLDGCSLRTMKREELFASVLRVEVLHPPLYWVKESDPDDQDFTEEILLSILLSSKGLLDLKELVIPSKAINVGGSVADSACSLKLWKEAREVLEGNEMIKSGEVKLRILEIGETSE